jgi:hypothetical protein
MRKQEHVHRFRRLKYKSGSTIFFCTLPDCSVKMNIALALGKRSLCWRCGQPFILDEYSLRLAKPHCENCHKPKNSVHTGVFNIPTEPVIEKELSLAERLKAISQANDAKEQEDDI